MIDVFESFAARQTGGGALTVTRATTPDPAYVNGYPVDPTAVTTIPIIAQVSPTDGRALKVLADQGITGESRMLLTATPVIPRSRATEGDRVAGVDLADDTGDSTVPWVVINAQTYTAPDGDVFYRVIVVRDTTR